MNVQRKIELMDVPRYSAYAHLLTKVFAHFGTYYAQKTHTVSNPFEERILAESATRLVNTVAALRLRHMYTPDYLRHPGVDLHASGFPHFYDINQLAVDLAMREEKLRTLPSIDALKPLLLEELLSGESPESGKNTEREADLCWQISERAYLEMLNPNTMFFQFTPHTLELLPQTPELVGRGRRAYVFSWGCYDTDTNRPCMYFLFFEQDMHDVPLETPNNPEYLKFVSLIQQIGARVPEKLLAIGARFDESFKTLYPKVLKRVCMGPLISPMLYSSIPDLSEYPFAQTILPLFQRAEEASDAFMLFFSSEYLISRREEVAQGMLSSLFPGKPKQVFDTAIPPHRYVLTSHLVRQHISDSDVRNIVALRGVDFLLYHQSAKEIVDVI